MMMMMMMMPFSERKYVGVCRRSELTLSRLHPRQPSPSIVVIDMGLHELPDWEMPEQVLQLTVPGLLERAALLPDLQSCNHVGPGMSRNTTWLRPARNMLGAAWPGRPLALSQSAGCLYPHLI